jgi:hypothetical protein
MHAQREKPSAFPVHNTVTKRSQLETINILPAVYLKANTANKEHTTFPPTQKPAYVDLLRGTVILIIQTAQTQHYLPTAGVAMIAMRLLWAILAINQKNPIDVFPQQLWGCWELVRQK